MNRPARRPAMLTLRDHERTLTAAYHRHRTSPERALKRQHRIRSALWTTQYRMEGSDDAITRMRLGSRLQRYTDILAIDERAYGAAAAHTVALCVESYERRAREEVAL